MVSNFAFEIQLACRYIMDRLHKWRRTVPVGGAGPGPDGSEQVERTLPNPMGRQHISPHIKTFLRYERDAGAGDGAVSSSSSSSRLGARLAWAWMSIHMSLM